MTARSLPSFCLHRIRSGRTAAAPPPICAKDENGDDAKAEEKEKGCGAVAIGEEGDDLRGYQPLEAMRSICQAKRPEVRIELSLLEGKERGPTIVEAARKQGVSLLVMGQKKRSMTWRLLSMWMAGGKGTGGNTVEYCVQHATCMALGIRRKSRRGGGYLITTRRQRDFWLLA
ncbi:hypothetical protein ACQ4PT_016335 [Festuca glaucescens]